MFEIDFLPVTGTTSEGSTKSGDAITVRFLDASGVQRVIVVDAGYQATGETVVEHLRTYYDTDRIDLAISTHPDADHINGLATVIDELRVEELWVHQPRLHVGAGVSQLSNISAIDTLLDTAAARGTQLTEPFTGLTRFGDMLRVLGPDKDFYDDLLVEQLLNAAALSASASLSRLVKGTRNLLAETLAVLPMVETLTDAGETHPRNETSVVTLLAIDGQQLLLSADAGQRSLARVADEYERVVGSFATDPLSLFQVPHHGSRRNVGPTLLDRILGLRGDPHTTTLAVVSAAKDAPKHPSPKVTNALLRRGAQVSATAGSTLCYSHDAPSRWNWVAARLLPPLDESGETDG